MTIVFKYSAGTTTTGSGFLLLALISELFSESLFTSHSLKRTGQRMEMNWYPWACHEQVSTKTGVRRSRTWIWRVRIIDLCCNRYPAHFELEIFCPYASLKKNEFKMIIFNLNTYRFLNRMQTSFHRYFTNFFFIKFF